MISLNKLCFFDLFFEKLKIEKFRFGILSIFGENLKIEHQRKIEHLDVFGTFNQEFEL